MEYSKPPCIENVKEEGFTPIHDLISAQAKRNPQKFALVHEEEKLTFLQLEQYSNAVSCNLRDAGIQKNDKVAIFLPSGIAPIVSILGVLKSGATYIPLSVQHPKERIKSILKVSECRFVLCHDKHQSIFENKNLGTIHYNRIDFQTYCRLPSVNISGNDNAYILFTSGSTGVPKGVIISHGNLSYYATWTQDFFRTIVGNRLPLTSDIIFAAAVSQMYSCLLAGETLHIVQNYLSNPELLFGWFSRHPDYALYCVPSVWSSAMNWYKSNQDKNCILPKKIFLSGEDVSKNLINETFQLFPEMEIWNLYGPTEAVANLSFKKIVSKENISIGSPLPGTKFYVVKEDGNPAQIGEKGILMVSGPGISKGYLNNLLLTEESFFLYKSLEDGEVLVYNTGDYVERIAENEYRFAGRKDQQVKINGQRIELLEIQQVLLKHAFVSEAVILFADNRLLGYVTSQNGREVNSTSLRKYLMDYLPLAMIPERIIFLDNFPVLGNGKINRKILPELKSAQSAFGDCFQKAANFNEDKIISIFQDVLLLECIGMNDNFFDLGGNSLKAIALVVEIQNKFNIKIGFQTFFRNPTPSGLLSEILKNKLVRKKSEKLEHNSKVSLLRPPQKDLWFIQKSYTESAAYNIVYSIEITGALDISNFEQALNMVLLANQTFHTAIRHGDDEPYLVFQSADYKLPVENLSIISPESRRQYVNDAIVELGSRPFDISGTLFRFCLYKIDDQNYILGFVIHHLIFDGESLGPFCRQLMKVYTEKEELNVPLISGIIQNQLIYARSEAYKKSVKFWEKYLNKAISLDGITNIYQNYQTKFLTGGTIKGHINEDLRARLEIVCKKKGITLNMLFLSVFSVVLYKIEPRKEYLIATPFSNRLSNEEQHAVGYLSNTLLLRVKFNDNLNFADLVGAIKQDIISILDHQQISLGELIKILRNQGIAIPITGFNTMFAYHTGSPICIEEKGIKLSARESKNNQTKCDLHFECFDGGTEIDLLMNYSKSTLDTAFALQFMRFMDQILKEVVENFESSIDSLLKVNSEEQKELLRYSKGLKRNFEGPMTLYHLFARQVNRTPNSIAIKFYEDRITYVQLEQKISLLFNYFNELPLAKNKPMMIYADHCTEMVIACLALSALAIPYLPVDPKFPSERINYIISDADVDYILTTKDQDLSFFQKKQIILVDEILENGNNDQEILIKVTESDLLYIIYTSGSTGNPKGVMVPNRGVANYLLWMKDTFKANHHTKVLAKTSISFDISVWELFLPLISGGTLILRNRADLESPEQIAKVIENDDVTIVQFVPSGLKLFKEVMAINKFQSLEHIFCGGEKLPTHLETSILKLFDGQLHNLYGPTEASIFMTHYRCTVEPSYANIPIGYPIFNSEIYVLDNNEQLVPRGIIGNLYIGGEILALGYLNKVDQTNKAFKQCANLAGKRLYKTGDKGRLLPDGKFQFFGREDHQIKIRGYRVEPGEIENAILHYPGVLDALVFKNQFEEDDERLTAVIVIEDFVDHIELKNFLYQKLPNYMIPSVFMEVDCIPKLPNGKIDLKSLKQSEVQLRPNDALFTIEENRDIESEIIKIWNEILGHSEFSIHDNFFEVGGHSVLFLKVKEKINQKLDADFSIVDLYQYPSIKAIALQYRKKFMNTAFETINSVRKRIKLKNPDMQNQNDFQSKIAVVGMDCRLPQANNVQEFWKNLLEEKECITDFSEEDLIAAGVSSKQYKHQDYVRRRGIVKDAEKFDAEFFNFTPREAELLDPQHRLFLECAWHALEDSGTDPFNTKNRIAVFGGTGSPYHLVDTIENESVLKYANGTSIITSNDKDYVTTRVSYKLNLKGPSVNVQSACSTSMVSIIMGMESLLNFNSDLVLAGGVTIELPVNKGYMYQSGSLESPDGKCRTFDKDAQGTVFSRGCGVVALKRFEDAIEENDHIYAVILGGSINNDGNRKAGYTAPSVQGQVEVITETIEIAGINPRSISMVEAHGTATQIGDPIEVASLSEAFRQYTDDIQFCAIGSVKTNIGHTDVASGVASFIKTCMSLKYGFIPASLNYIEPNPEIHFEESPFFVNTQTTHWETSSNMPRRALINSFGVGGTNACVILEEPPKRIQPEITLSYDTLLLSAHNTTSFKMYGEALIDKIKNEPELNLNALAYTSRVARKSMKYKSAFSFNSREDLLNKIEKSTAIKQNTLEKKELVMMFPGQGNQFINMGRELYENISIFKETVDYCALLLEQKVGLDLRKIIYPNLDSIDKSKEIIDHTYITQPSIFIVSYAMAITLKSYGIVPTKLVGHSVGEYVAAALSGIMTLEDALMAVAIRGKLVYDLPKGSMLAVLMNEQEIMQILPDTLNIAVINSPELVVVSGKTQHISNFSQLLKSKKVFNKQLSTSHAFHSKMMEPCLHSFREFFNTIQLYAPKVPVISTVTGKLLTDAEAQNHEYWVNHIIDPVRFGSAVKDLLSNESVVFLECGPGQSLESAVKRQLQKDHQHAVISTLHDGTDAIFAMDEALGKLWIEDISIDFDKRYENSGVHKIPFPLLPFNRKPYLIDFSSKKVNLKSDENLKKENIEDWFYMPSWKKTAGVEFIKRNRKYKEVNSLWVIFVESEFSKSIVRYLINERLPYYSIEKGVEFNQQGNLYTLHPSKKEDYKRLFSILGHEERPLNIIYTWSFQDWQENIDRISLLNASHHLEDNFYNVLHLEQGLIDAHCIKDIRLVSLVNDAFSVVGDETTLPEKSLVVGPMRVLYKEHVGISTLLINIDSKRLLDFESKLIESIIEETVSETDESIISYSGLSRWTEIYEEIKFQENEFGSQLKDNGIYFITGGSGGIGRIMSLLIAEQTENAIIVWTGRQSLPRREEWDLILSQNNLSQNTIDKLQTIKQIEALGGKVISYSADVTDFEQMKSVFDDVESKFGKINGVIHSAGVAGGGVVASKQRPEIDLVLNPKVFGTLVLKELLKNKEIDFVYLFSSITAILGEAGRVDYISGNAFLDACANARQWLHNRAKVTSINWGQWGLVGMAADYQIERINKKKEFINLPLQHTLENEPISTDLIKSDQNEFCSKINVDAQKHWILSEHLLLGNPAMVGTSFVNFLMKWKDIAGLNGYLQLKDAVFLSPMIMMRNMPRSLYLFCNKENENQYNFVFRSLGESHNKNGKEDWKDLFDGKILIKDELIEKECNIETLKSKFTNKDEKPHFLVIRDNHDKLVLQYSQRWNCKKRTYIGEHEWLTLLEMDSQFSNDFISYPLHPALLDVATSAHFMYLEVNANYLPYSYKEVNVYGPLEPSCYCYSKLTSDLDETEQLTFDFQIYNQNGKLLSEFLEYSFIRISESARTKTNRIEGTSIIKAEAMDSDILPEEGKQVLQTLLGQKDLSQVIVYTKDMGIDFKESKISFLRNEFNKKKIILTENIETDDRPDINTPYEAPSNEVEKSIAGIWTMILGIHKIGIHDTFNSLGGNSLLAIQVISGIKEEFGVEIATDEFINNPTIFKLTEVVIDKIILEHDAQEIEMLLND